MKDLKQNKVADVLHQYKDAFIVGFLNEEEMAAKILDAIRFDDMPKFDHDCKLDEWLSGVCPHPSHDYQLIENVSCYACTRDGEPCAEHSKVGTASEEYRHAN